MYNYCELSQSNLQTTRCENNNKKDEIWKVPESAGIFAEF